MRNSFFVSIILTAGLIVAPFLAPVGLGFEMKDYEQQLRLPKRALDALSGSEVLNATAQMSESDRERFLLDQILAGNVPSFLRELKPVSYTENVGGQLLNFTFYTLPDYLAIGSDIDYIRMPVNFLSAKTIAKMTGMTLPTKKMVDKIYKSSDIKLAPSPMRPGSKMHTNAYYAEHNRKIEQDLEFRTGIVAGHKKDIIITNKLNDQPHRIAIYGWHRLNGRRIQPVSLVHGEKYADYSHGLRLVAKHMKVNGVYFNVFDLLKNKDMAKALSDEGMITNAAMLSGHEAQPSFALRSH